MPRFCAVPLILLAALLAAGPAGARSFTVSKSGNNPSLAVDPAGTAHIVWDTVTASGASTTHYCRVPRSAAGCASGSARTFAPEAGNQDFAGPRVYVQGGGKRVVIVTSRCCTSADAPDGLSYDSHLYSFVSSDGGKSFAAPTWFGSLAPELGGSLGPGDVFWTLGITDNGTSLQASPIGAFQGAVNTISTKNAQEGGVGTAGKVAVVAFNDVTNVYAGRVSADPNAAASVTQVAKGEDTHVDSGVKGPDVLYRTSGSKARYVVQRWSGSKLGPAQAVSETGFPVFGNLFQDAAGRVHTVWQAGNGVIYRVSDTNARHFGKKKVLSGKTGFFNLLVAANPKGKATVVYDSNGYAGRVGGFTAG